MMVNRLRVIIYAALQLTTEICDQPAKEQEPLEGDVIAKKCEVSIAISKFCIFLMHTQKKYSANACAKTKLTRNDLHS
jgi:hypothetical protein